jgi:PIN domain nuclease of toxin-antitoxin system
MIDSQDFHVLDVTLRHAHRAGLLPGPHRDPFDRLLIAQAHAELLPVVSADTIFDGYGVRRIWE